MSVLKSLISTSAQPQRCGQPGLRPGCHSPLLHTGHLSLRCVTAGVCNNYVGMFVVVILALAVRRCALGLERAWAGGAWRGTRRSRGGRSRSLLRKTSSPDSRRSSYGSCEGEGDHCSKGEERFKQPRLAGWCDRVDRVALRPVKLPLVPASWDWAQLALVSAIVTANVAACLISKTRSQPKNCEN